MSSSGPGLVGVVVSVGLADSINPSTVGVGLYLAGLRGAVAQVLLFTLGVFTVNFVVGVGLTIGPGRFLLGFIPHPQGDIKHAIQFAAGLILIAAAVGLWLGRRRLSRRKFSAGGGRRGSSLMAGASIAAVELPTAAPYFAVMTALAASSAAVSRQIGLLALYNAAFVAPLLAIAIVVAVAGERGMRWLAVAGAWLRRRWPVVLSGLLLLVGGALVILGAVGLVKQ